jgi:hypothetical protein
MNRPDMLRRTHRRAELGRKSAGHLRRRGRLTVLREDHFRSEVTDFGRLTPQETRS